MISNVGGDVDATVEERRLIREQIWKHLELEECILRLKSGQNWLKEGDLNTRFYHNSLKSKMRINYISLVIVNDGMVESVAEEKFHIKQHFMNFFKEQCFQRPVPGVCVSRGWLNRHQFFWSDLSWKMRLNMQFGTATGEKLQGRTNILWISSRTIRS